METSGPIRVLILYVHPLLGEGLAKLLAAEPGIATRAVAADDAPGAVAALADPPDAVIVECRREPPPATRRATEPAGTVAGLAALAAGTTPDGTAPLLLFVDIEGATTPSGTEGNGGAASVVRPTTDDLERIVRAVRGLRGGRLELVGA